MNHNAKLYVIRLNASGGLAKSQPCSLCCLWLKFFRIKKVIYSTETGELVEKRTKELLEDRDPYITSGRRFLIKMSLK